MREGGNSSYQADSCSSSSAQLLFSPTPLSFTNGTCGAICWVSAAFFILHEAAVLCPPVYITQAGGGVLAVAHITCATPPNVEWRLHCSTDSAIAGRRFWLSCNFFLILNFKWYFSFKFFNIFQECLLDSPWLALFHGYFLTSKDAQEPIFNYLYIEWDRIKAKLPRSHF